MNQPGGELRHLSHPAISGREVELRRLADTVRRLVAATVDHTLGAAATDELTARLAVLADELEAAMPDEPHTRFTDLDASERGPHDGSPFDVVYGLYNPLAVPLRMSFEGGRSIGEGVYSTAYEGPPGCVHGAVIAGAFDMILSAATMPDDLGGPTVSLQSTFRNRTLLRVPVRYEGWVADVEGRRVRVLGQLLQKGEVTVEAEAVFVTLDRAEIMRLAERGDRS